MLVPKLTQKNGLEDMMVIEFMAKKKGHLSNFKIIKPLADGCDEVAWR
ncbi:MAG: hypothetical protein ACJAUH_000168 [Saprospiraceae bacterium]